MVSENIQIICYITGFLTSSMLLLCCFPQFVLQKLLRVDIARDSAAELIARHWGMVVCVTGLMLIYAGYDEAARKPILFLVGLNKAVFVLLMLFKYNRQYGRSFIVNFLFDILCIVLYAIYVIGAA